MEGDSHGALSASVCGAPPTRGVEHASRMHRPCGLPGHAELLGRFEQSRAWSRMHCAARLLVRAFLRAWLMCTQCVHRGTAPCPVTPRPLTRAHATLFITSEGTGEVALLPSLPCTISGHTCVRMHPNATCKQAHRTQARQSHGRALRPSGRGRVPHLVAHASGLGASGGAHALAGRLLCRRW